MNRIEKACLVALLFCSVTLLRAQAPSAPASSRINRISVIGYKMFPSEQIAAATGLKPGDMVTATQIQDAANRLAALGYFSNVNFHYTSKGDAIDIEFQVVEAPLYSISFDNFPWFTDAQIGDAIRAEVGFYGALAPEGGAALDQMAAAIEHLLASKMIQGSVAHQLVAAPVGEGMVMQFHLEGPPLRIQSVSFGDPVAAGSERLKDRVRDIKGQPYSRFAVELFETEQIRPAYAAKGFLRAQIGPPQTNLIPDANNPKQSAVDLTIPIQPGASYTWNGVAWQGNSAIPTTNLDGAVELKPGDVADGMKIEALWQKIEGYYGQHGYLDMKLNPMPVYDDSTHSIGYRVNITEGPQYRMGEMIVTGLSLDAEKRLRQAWRIAPGEVFDDTYYESRVKTLSKPSRDVFGEMPVHYNEFGHLLRPNPERHTVDVLLDFK